MKVVAGFPTYDGSRKNTATVVQVATTGAVAFELSVSLLGRCFNECYVRALNEPEATHFLMVHADVLVTTRGFVKKMVELMTVNQASVLSAVIPLKITGQDLTSTALETDDPWNPRKLSLKEVYERPPTWTEEGLLVNTGCMLVDLRKPWADQLYFTLDDRIRKDGDKWIAESKPEDWNFSRLVKEKGGSVWATREIELVHWGSRPYNNVRREK